MSNAHAQHSVPAPLLGTWVANNATCDAPLRMVVAADRLTLVNGKDSQSLGGVEMAGPGYFPPDYRGIQQVLLAEFSGHQPVIVTFNANEKKGAALVEFAPVMPGTPTPQLKIYNAHIAKLNLAKRFAFGKIVLKKCG